MNPLPPACDVAIVGAGAAGLATAIFLRRANPAATVILLDGAVRPGAKILVSGGSRCNVTNAAVGESDFWGGKRTIIRRVLRALPVDETVAFFRGLGVALHEEPGGKLFPDSNRARDVLEALLRGVDAAGARLLTGTRVHAIARDGSAFVLHTSGGELKAGAILLTTGGRSLPKTGSDGTGYTIAASLGHSLVPQTPALAPLVLDPQTPHSVHRALSGVSLDGEIAVWTDDAVTTRLRGALLWTHFGVSGPLALNASRHWARAHHDGRRVRLSLNVYPGRSFEEVEALWVRLARDRPTATLRRTLASEVPDAFATSALEVLRLPPDRTLAT